MPNNCEIVVCPFFKSRTRRNAPNAIDITCETIEKMGFRMKNKLSFGSVKEREDWMEIFCEDIENYTNCPYAKLISKKYEEE